MTDSFNQVKDVLESDLLKKNRKNDVYKALKQGLTQKAEVSIFYSDDTLKVKELRAEVVGISEDVLLTGIDTKIPIRAIHQIRF